MADAAGLFGPSPWEVQQAQQQAQRQQVMDMSRMDATQMGKYGMLSAGAGIADWAAPKMGGVNMAQQQAQKTQEVMGTVGTDFSTSDGMMRKANEFRVAGDLRTAGMLTMKANELKRQEAAAALATRKQDFQEGEAADLKRLQVESAIEAKRAALQQQADAAKLRSEDMRYSADQRAEAAKYAADARREIAMLMASLKQSQGNGAGGSATPPKNLTREARLKWELEHGMIDQAAYDSAMSASPGGVLRQKQQDAVNASVSQFDLIKGNISNLANVGPDGKVTLKPAAQSLFGQYAQYRPEMTMSQESVDAKVALEALTDQVMLANLADAKQRVGQSFGSMQVQEWDKFTNQLKSLKRAQSEASATSALAEVLSFIEKKRNVLNVALGTPNTAEMERTVPGAPPAPAKPPAAGGAKPKTVIRFDAQGNMVK